MARILVVEDDEDMREAYAACLTGSGYEVFSAATAEEAIGMSGEHDFDLLIVDLWLPGMDGAELARTIRAGEIAADLSPVPILMVTNMGERMGITVTPADTRWAPVDRYIDKTTAVGKLSEIAAELLAARARSGADGSS